MAKTTQGGAARGKSAAAPGQKKKAAGLQSARTLTKPAQVGKGYAPKVPPMRPATSPVDAAAGNVRAGVRGAADLAGSVGGAVGSFIGNRNAQVVGPSSNQTPIGRAMKAAPQARKMLNQR